MAPAGRHRYGIYEIVGLTHAQLGRFSKSLIYKTVQSREYYRVAEMGQITDHRSKHHLMPKNGSLFKIWFKTDPVKWSGSYIISLGSFSYIKMIRGPWSYWRAKQRLYDNLSSTEKFTFWPAQLRIVLIINRITDHRGQNNPDHRLSLKNWFGSRIFSSVKK